MESKLVKGGKRFMKQKYVLSIIACSLFVFIAIGFVSACGMAQNIPFMKFNMTEEEKQEIKELNDAIQTAIEDGNYEEWESLMQEKISKMQENINEETFNQVVEMHQNREEQRAAMKERAESGELPGFEDKEFKRGRMRFEPSLSE